MIIDDAYLYKYMPAAEMILMNRIPPEEELDHQFSRRFCRKMKALLKYERRTPRERAVYRGMKLAFATLAVILLVVFGSVMSVKAYRSRLIEFIVEVFETKTSYIIQEEMPDGEEIIIIEPKYIPKGYSVKELEISDSGCYISYQNDFGDKVYYKQTGIGALARFWDTENAVLRDMYINKQKVTVLEEDGMRTVYWSDDAFLYSILDSGQVDLEEILKMVKSVL